MYCLANICYVCLSENKDSSLIDINSSSMNADIFDIIGYLPCNLAWLQTKRIVQVCEECCRRFRQTYEFLAMCLKNSALLQGYIDKLNTASIPSEDTDALVDLNNTRSDNDKIKCEIKLEEDEMYTVEPIIEENEIVFLNVDDSFVKDEDSWKREAVDDREDYPMDNSETSDHETDSEYSANSDTDSDSSASTQVRTTIKKEPHSAATKTFKCPTCGKSFSTKSILQVHTRVHTGEKPYKCALCEKCFVQKSNVIFHMRTHTGERPYECSKCEKCFRQRSGLVHHMRTHTGERPYECSKCRERFGQHSGLVHHMRTHTGERPYECTKCMKCFSQHSGLACHMRLHTGERPYECTKCMKCFSQQSNLTYHMRLHTGEQPNE